METIDPARRRLMLLPSKALWLVTNSATSICSSVTLGDLCSLAIFDSVSPRFTGYCSPPAPSRAAAAASAAAGAAAGRGGATPMRTGATGSTGLGVTPGGSSRKV